jgi:hypothetical protein
VIPYQYGPGGPMTPADSQLAFVGPEGSTLVWDVGTPGAFDSPPLTCPARFNFPQGEIYRLKMGNLPNRPGVELYPTVEVAMAVPRTEAFLAHSPIPIEFTQEDLDQVLTGNFVTKVIYLPDPEFQELAVAGVGTLVSTRLDPGIDPINEASRRGAILAVVRVGNKDLQLPGGQPQEGTIAPVSYQTPSVVNYSAGTPLPMGVPANATAGVPTSHVAGVTAPQYGSPSCPTPIGLPGPPYIPLGAPAGLQKYTIRNHSIDCLPRPTKKVSVDVMQVPGDCLTKGGLRHTGILQGNCAEKACRKGGDCLETGECAGGMPQTTTSTTTLENCYTK